MGLEDLARRRSLLRRQRLLRGDSYDGVTSWARDHPILTIIVGTAVLVMVALLIGRGMSSGEDSRSVDGAARSADLTLADAVPDRWGSGDYFELSRFDADYLERTGTRSLDFVAADVVSDNPNVVSVNAIDANTWSAAVVSADDRCFAILLTFNPSDHERSAEFSTQLPPGVPCKASVVTRAGMKEFLAV